MNACSKTTMAFCLLLFSLILPLNAEAAYRYSFSTELNVGAPPPNSNNSLTLGTLGQVLEDTMRVDGPSGAYAEGKAAVDFSRGTIKTYAYATTGTGVNGGNEAYATAAGGFTDYLFFYIPTGTHHADLYVDFMVSIDGSLTYSGAAGDPAPLVGQQWEFSASNSSAPAYVNQNSNGTYRTPGDFSRDLKLSLLLAHAGEYVEEQKVAVNLTGSLLSQAWVKEGTHGLSWAETDFYNTASIDAIVAPTGVTWDSFSGQFLSAPPPGDDGDMSVPEPASLLLLSLGLGFLAVLKLRESE